MTLSNIRRGVCQSHNQIAMHEDYVFWVATMKRRKSPELFFDTARHLPQYRFRMVGGSDGDNKFREVINYDYE
jgi:hypothetical protein